MSENNKIEPYINNDYRCGSCGNIGLSDPETSMCFICGDDNWIAIDESVFR